VSRKVSLANARFPFFDISPTKKARWGYQQAFLFLLAEEEGFEPPDLLQSAVFKTAAIDHSATPLKNEMVKWHLSKEWKPLY
jgi:hypothetical protein